MVKLDLTLPRENIAEFASVAERIGISGLWSREIANDPYIPLALCAASTQQLTLGTAIAVAFARSPLSHASAAWDLQLMAPGRVILGLGAQVRGHNERRYSVSCDRPRSRLSDMVRAIRAIWRAWQEGSELNYVGEFYSHTLMPPFFRPPSLIGPLPEIFIAAVGGEMLKLAGAEADGVHIHPLHSMSSLDLFTLPAISAGQAASTRQRKRITTATTVLIASGESSREIDAAREVVRAQVAFYCSTRSYKPVLSVHGWEERSDVLHDLASRGRWSEMPRHVDDEMLDAFAVTARPSELAVALLEKYDGRVDRIAPYSEAPANVSWAALAKELASNGTS